MTGRTGWRLIVEDRLGIVSDQREIQDGILVVGRSRQCDLVLPSESVSRRHARFSVQRGRLILEDLGSSNGVWIGGRRVQEAQVIEDGEVIRIGEFRIRVQGPRAPVSDFPRLRLVGRSPGVRDQVVEMSQEVMMVGRGRDCGLVVLDPSVSRNHARLLTRMDGSVIVEDLDSANGVFVNDSRIRIRELANGDRLRFGDVEFLVEMPEAGTIRRRHHHIGRFWVAALVSLVALGLAAVVVWWKGQRTSGGVESFPMAVQSSPSGGEADARTSGEADAGPGTVEARASPGEVPLDVSGALERARGLLEQGRLDDAERLIREVLAAQPLNPSAVRLENRLARERQAAEALASSDREQAEGRLESALQALFSIPRESVFLEDVRARLKAIRPSLERERTRACRAGPRSVSCIRWKALLQKVDTALEPGTDGRRSGT